MEIIVFLSETRVIPLAMKELASTVSSNVSERTSAVKLRSKDTRVGLVRSGMKPVTLSASSSLISTT